MQSQRVVWPQQGLVQLEQVNIPAPGDEQLLIRTHVSLISPGTERAFFLGLPNTSQKYPNYPGYSNIGEVVQIGAKVRGWKVGDRVASSARHAMHAVIDAQLCVPVPQDLPAERAVFFNMATIAIQAVRKARIELGESVVVIGAGLVGLLTAQLANIDGALPVISVDQEESRLEFARKVGIDAAIPADDELLSTVRRLCDSEGANVVIDATGSPEVVVSAFALAAQLGRVILLGSTRGDTKAVNFYRDVHKKGLTIVGAHNSVRPAHESSSGLWTNRDDHRVVLKLLASQRLCVHPLITHQFAWQQADQAYSTLVDPGSAGMGIVLDWR